MMTQASLLHLPKENSSRDLAFFLRTTGPSEVQVQTKKEDIRHQLITATRKKALRLLRSRAARQSLSLTRLSRLLRDEGGVLDESNTDLIPTCYEQKVSTRGIKYLALREPNQPHRSKEESWANTADDSSKLNEIKHIAPVDDEAFTTNTEALQIWLAATSRHNHFGPPQSPYTESSISKQSSQPAQAQDTRIPLYIRDRKDEKLQDGLKCSNPDTSARSPAEDGLPNAKSVAGGPGYTTDAYLQAKAGFHRERLTPAVATITTSCTGPITAAKVSSETSRVSSLVRSGSRRLFRQEATAVKSRGEISARSPEDSITTDTAGYTTAQRPSHRMKLRILIPGMCSQPKALGSSLSSGCQSLHEEPTAESPYKAKVMSFRQHTDDDYEPQSSVSACSETCADDANLITRMSFVPVAFVANKIAIPRRQSKFRPLKVIVNRRLSYTPRPRSAHLSQRSKTRRRSRRKATLKESCPPRPDVVRSCPNAAAASASHGNPSLDDGEPSHHPRRPRFDCVGKEMHRQGNDARTRNGDMNYIRQTDARLDALEQQNALLSAALAAVLRGGGEMGP